VTDADVRWTAAAACAGDDRFTADNPTPGLLEELHGPFAGPARSPGSAGATPSRSKPYTGSRPVSGAPVRAQRWTASPPP